MFTDWLRKVSRGIVQPLATFLARLGISANVVTILGCLMNIGVAVILASGRLRLGGVLLIAAAGIDGLDGSLARLNGTPTRFGALLDSVLDRVSESALFLGLAWWYMGQPGIVEELLAYIAVVGSLLVSYVRARAEGIGVPCTVGLFTRVERSILLIAALILGFTVPALWILAVGTWLTTIHRIIAVYQCTGDAPLAD
ncbi:MAG TPA: CDP-alcohol phosphatidyltransferase family protein [Chloroflexi bacterium]|jgi:CDP-diacylglycerol--glycerol-3-phosphate 3-phosphatidyltransferase|nr:CDP-alcohol phosphatidyltransferase family protein [Chloroflexota bacterium]